MKLDDTADLTDMCLALIDSTIQARDTAFLNDRAATQHSMALGRLLSEPLDPASSDLHLNAYLIASGLAEIAAEALRQLSTNVPGFDTATWLQQYAGAVREG